jgi:glycine dehydrogenase
MDIHPMAPVEQTKGYEKLLKELKAYLGELTGLKNVSFQPNSGAQGEYAGLRVIKAFHQNSGDPQRTKCLVPASAHGTNPASAKMAGLEVVKVPCLPNGALDLATLAETVESDGNKIASIMVTYPSTFGSFDESILKACEMVKAVNGMVYLDGANMNAMVGYLRPVDVEADVCHLNLHKTFCIPHGGGGPGAGPIAVSDQLAPFLPSDPHSEAPSRLCLGSISGSPFGSASILTISWAYIRMMGLSGLREATFKALLNANYMMTCLARHYPISFNTGSPYCAHEFIVDLGPFADSSNITALDVAKRLQVS